MVLEPPFPLRSVGYGQVPARLSRRILGQIAHPLNGLAAVIELVGEQASLGTDRSVP